MQFEAYADLANMGAHLDVASEQTPLITHDGRLHTNSFTVSKIVHVLIITTCEGEALSISGFLDSSTLWIGSEASAEEARVWGQRWKSHSIALGMYSQSTCQIGVDVQRGTRPW